MLNCFTDEKHNAISQQMNLPPGAMSAFFKVTADARRSSSPVCLNSSVQSKRSVSSLIPQVRSMPQLPPVSADGEESRHGSMMQT